MGVSTDTKSRHTPGPWMREGAYVFAPGVEKAANICAVSELRASRYVGYNPLNLGSKDFEEAIANACLIAAAPTMHTDLATISRAVRRLLTPEQCALLTDEEEAAFGRAEGIASGGTAT